ncbi:hypothetical protein BX600DRAFT_436471 [Xylariales sp. PMI_506]|nr:hypothetical protein BX600DRAFT_436471 [Xylariales sp. PMI_506]
MKPVTLNTTLALIFALALEVNSTVISKRAAAEEVSTDSAASGVKYFPYEAIQLTAAVIAGLESLDEDNTDAFSFGDSTFSRKSGNSSNLGCKSLPGDSSWPSSSAWLDLNHLLDGTLLEGVPSAAVCYQDWPQYDQSKCDEVTTSWTNSFWQADEATGIDWPVFEGVTCVPPSFAPPNTTCTLGGLPSYIVNVTNVAQIQLAINFARNRNIRLVVKNTGHDFVAKSTGAGSLSIWTHNLRDIEYLGDAYQSTAGHIGPAFKIGAGVLTEDLYKAAEAKGLQVVGGIVPSIGIGGGYVAGGGHSPFISKYGMGADQVISVEVVLPNGSFVSADETTNPDLFFALRGGGGSTWGVVTSLVLRAYPSTPITKVTYTFGTGVDVDTFWAGLNALFSYFPSWPKAGLYAYWSITCANTTSCVFAMAPQLAPDLNQSQLQDLLQPFFSNLTDLGIPVDDLEYVEYDNFLDAFEDTFPESDVTVGTWLFHTASRLFPESNWQDEEKFATQMNAIRTTALSSGFLIGYNYQPAVNAAVNQKNAVNPAFRDSVLFLMSSATWTQNATAEDIATANKDLVAALQPWRDASPGSGTYLNEADINEPDWQQAFYGVNYAYLYKLKQEYDPWGLFYASTAVGAENWYITGQLPYYPTQNGRLCHT